MPRPMHVDVIALLASGAALRLAVLVEVQVDGGAVRRWSGLGNLVNPLDGQTYQGAGDLGTITDVQESIDLVAAGMVFHLAAAEASIIALALASFRQGKLATTWLAFLDAAGAIIGEPLVLWKGFTDVPKLQLGPNSSDLAISAESRLLELERENTRKYTDEDQRRFHPTDRGFNFVTSLQDKEIPFGPNS